MDKIVKKLKILVDLDKISKLAEKNGCHTTCVYNALAYRTNSKKAGEIRKMALERFGGEIVKVPMRVK